jgi:hypothetical protein
MNDPTANRIQELNQQFKIQGLVQQTTNNNQPEDLASYLKSTGIDSPVEEEEEEKKKKKKKKKPREKDGSIIGAVGYGLKAMQAFGKPTKEVSVLPDYSKSDARINKMNSNLTQAKQDAQAGSNTLSNINRNSASGFNSFRNRQVQNIANLQDKTGQINFQEQGLRNQILGQQGQYEAGKAQTIRNINDETNVRNEQNRALQRNLRTGFGDDMLVEADRLATTKNAKKLANMSNTETLAYAKSMYPDFEPTPDFYNNLEAYGNGEIKWEDLSEVEQQVIKYKNSK